MTRFVFWQNILAFYQAATINNLAAHEGVEVVWVVERQLDDIRKDQGWVVPTTDRARIVVAPDDETINSLINEAPERSVHIFSGVSKTGFVLPRKAYLQCLKAPVRPAQLGILVENRDDRGLKGFGRLLMYRVEYYQIGRQLDFILSMGYGGKHGGRRWYRRCGYPDSKIFPCGYFVDGVSPEEAKLSEEEIEASNHAVKIIFVGQLVERKGVDVLLKALGNLKQLNWTCDIIGSGESQEALESLASESGIKDRVKFLPYMPNVEVMKMVESSDLFVLPSRFDGWGVVVNEALLRGVPVLCSDRCGAQDLVREEWRGGVFHSESVPDLTRSLELWIKKGRKTSQEASRRIEWSQCLNGASGADYIMNVANSIEKGGPRPAPPWFV